jgi:hypothetical protein
LGRPATSIQDGPAETVRRHLAELAEAGELPGRRPAGEWRFARDAVLDRLARR